MKYVVLAAALLASCLVARWIVKSCREIAAYWEVQ